MPFIQFELPDTQKPVLKFGYSFAFFYLVKNINLLLMKKITFILILFATFLANQSKSQGPGGGIGEIPVGGETGEGECALLTNTLSISSYCAGQTISIGYTIDNPSGGIDCIDFTDVNFYLSDASGNFTNQVLIGTTSASGANPCTCQIPLNTTAGNGYKVKAVASDDSYSSTASATIITIANLNLDAGQEQFICVGDEATLTATGADTYTWSPAASLNSTTGASVTTIVLNSVGSNTFVVTGSRVGCPDATDEIVVTVDPNITVNAGDDVSVCLGDTVALNATGGAEYTWSPFSSLSNSSGNTVGASPSVNTTYTVSSESNGCFSSDEVMVTVLALPTFVASEDVSVCVGESSTFRVGATADENTYTWFPNFEGDVLERNPSVYVRISPTLSSAFIITTTGENMCSANDTISITLNSLPTLAIAPSGNITATSGSPVALTASGAVTYSWTPANKFSSATGTTVNFSSTTVGSNSISVIGVDANGCQSSLSFAINVSSSSGNSIEEERDLGWLSVYPNPYKGLTNIVFTTLSSLPVQIEVFNLLGQNVHTIVNGALAAGEHKYVFSAIQNNQPAGVYFIKSSIGNTNTTIRLVEMK